jgi:hypothetical protein
MEHTPKIKTADERLEKLHQQLVTNTQGAKSFRTAVRKRTDRAAQEIVVVPINNWRDEVSFFVKYKINRDWHTKSADRLVAQELASTLEEIEKDLNTQKEGWDQKIQTWQANDPTQTAAIMSELRQHRDRVAQTHSRATAISGQNRFGHQRTSRTWVDQKDKVTTWKEFLPLSHAVGNFHHRHEFEAGKGVSSLRARHRSENYGSLKNISAENAINDKVVELAAHHFDLSTVLATRLTMDIVDTRLELLEKALREAKKPDVIQRLLRELADLEKQLRIASELPIADEKVLGENFGERARKAREILRKVSRSLMHQGNDLIDLAAKELDNANKLQNEAEQLRTKAEETQKRATEAPINTADLARKEAENKKKEIEANVKLQATARKELEALGSNLQLVLTKLDVPSNKWETVTEDDLRKNGITSQAMLKGAKTNPPAKMGQQTGAAKTERLSVEQGKLDLGEVARLMALRGTPGFSAEQKKVLVRELNKVDLGGRWQTVRIQDVIAAEGARQAKKPSTNIDLQGALMKSPGQAAARGEAMQLIAKRKELHQRLKTLAEQNASLERQRAQALNKQRQALAEAAELDAGKAEFKAAMDLETRAADFKKTAAEKKQQAQALLTLAATYAPRNVVAGRKPA